MLAILLLDENTSPRIIKALWEQHLDVVHIRDRGLLGAADHILWNLAVEESRTIITINGKDFRRLAERTEVHPGVVVIPGGGDANSQLNFIMSAVNWMTSTNSELSLSNRYIEINESGEIEVAEVLFETKKVK